MRHSVFGRKLSRTKNERRRLFAILMRNFLEHDTLTTTVAKAKTIQPMVEKLITKAKEGSEASRRRVEAVLTDRNLTRQLFDDAKTRFSARTSGFTRVVKVGKRKSDATEEAMITFVDPRVAAEVVKPEKKTKKVVPPKISKPRKSPKQPKLSKPRKSPKSRK